VVRIETIVDAGARAAVEQGLRASNRERSAVMRELDARGEGAEVPLDVYAFDDHDELVGGLTGATWAQWLQVDLLWVHADRRGEGLGGRLLAEAERLARDERGCVAVRLETWGFQARPFYEARGYAVFGVLEGYPPGETEYHLTKRLT
jgi:GNAT superfamily N-acetyltransferase